MVHQQCLPQEWDRSPTVRSGTEVVFPSLGRGQDERGDGGMTSLVYYGAWELGCTDAELSVI